LRISSQRVATIKNPSGEPPDHKKNRKVTSILVGVIEEKAVGKIMGNSNKPTS
jgi:hypothetical protein